jgi:hypothetical protein
MRLLRTLCLAAVFQFDEIALARRTTRMTGDECCLCHVFRSCGYWKLDLQVESHPTAHVLDPAPRLPDYFRSQLQMLKNPLTVPRG